MNFPKIKMYPNILFMNQSLALFCFQIGSIQYYNLIDINYVKCKSHIAIESLYWGFPVNLLCIV